MWKRKKKLNKGCDIGELCNWEIKELKTMFSKDEDKMLTYIREHGEELRNVYCIYVCYERYKCKKFNELYVGYDGC